MDGWREGSPGHVIRHSWAPSSSQQLGPGPWKPLIYRVRLSPRYVFYLRFLLLMASTFPTPGHLSWHSLATSDEDAAPFRLINTISCSLFWWRLTSAPLSR